MTFGKLLNIIYEELGLSKLLNIIYEELGLLMLILSITMVPMLTIMGACLLAHTHYIGILGDWS